MKCIYFGADVYSGLWPTNTVAELAYILLCVGRLGGGFGEGGSVSQAKAAILFDRWKTLFLRDLVRKKRSKIFFALTRE